MEYENIDDLLADLTTELSFPINVREVLEHNEPLCMWVVNIVNAFMAKRVGYASLCGADDRSMLYKYCKHRQHAFCSLYDEECRFKSTSVTKPDKVKKRIWPCPNCGGDAWHREDCKLAPGKAF